jgi:ubiquinone/menaquinone biosynthesis C-methylase UbiE
MPDVLQNSQQGAEPRVWLQRGEEWSKAWGDPERQWRGCLLPRIGRFLPAKTILEIAPGFGRWTQFLQAETRRLIGVDLSARCVQACRERFVLLSHASFYQNDGKSLGMVPGASVDFVFSFDSLVHAEADVIEGYLSELRRVLKPEGVAFLHHSNYGAYAVSPALMALGHIRGLRQVLWRLRAGGLQPNPHWRGETMSAARLRDICPRYGLRCFEQELVNWGASYLNDCFSYITLAEARGYAQETRIIENEKFMEEAERIKEGN